MTTTNSFHFTLNRSIQSAPNKAIIIIRGNVFIFFLRHRQAASGADGWTEGGNGAAQPWSDDLAESIFTSRLNEFVALLLYTNRGPSRRSLIPSELYIIRSIALDSSNCIIPDPQKTHSLASASLVNSRILIIIRLPIHRFPDTIVSENHLVLG